eukprot:TRINITY_DN2326_c0_g1_i1.p1 TRINITY_DN2326_c0_g1~~TRINITY_DN2326_c0_g1_i1.p1  ORF type:complete len:369 (+),score=60.19 TRINITY_DN2326_c0_g1_i1:445-1551(+)
MEPDTSNVDGGTEGIYEYYKKSPREVDAIPPNRIPSTSTSSSSSSESAIKRDQTEDLNQQTRQSTTTATTVTSASSSSTPSPLVPELVKKKKPTYERKLDFETNSKRSVRLERIAKTNKLLWTTELHQIFLHAIRKLGVNATPKEIRATMNVAGLTRDNIASHLQKYRAKLRAAVTSEAMEALLKQEEELLALPLSEGPITLVTKPKSRPKEKELASERSQHQTQHQHHQQQQHQHQQQHPLQAGSAFSQFPLPQWPSYGMRGAPAQPAGPMQVLSQPPVHHMNAPHLGEDTYSYLMNPFLINSSFVNPMVNPIATPSYPMGSLGKLSSPTPGVQSSSPRPSIFEYLTQPFPSLGRQETTNPSRDKSY